MIRVEPEKMRRAPHEGFADEPVPVFQQVRRSDHEHFEFPLHRLALPIGGGADAPAVYVSAPDLRVGRLEQHYEHLDDRDGGSRYRYRAPQFSFETVIRFDGSGLVDDYPTIAERVC